MFQRKHRIVVVIALLAITAQFTGAASAALVGGRVTADGYYDSAGGAFIFSGARSDMECSFPVIRDGVYSAMRVGVTHRNLNSPTNDAFIETGCVRNIARYGDQARRIYGSWITTSGLFDYRTFYMAPGSYTANDYRVGIKNDNPTVWSFIYNGVTWPETINVGFVRGASVVCGGEASSSQNAIGPAACWNARYKNNNLTTWVAIPSYQTRVSAGYTVAPLNANSWQSYGNN